MAMNVEFANINPFDCTGNPTSVGPRWRRWKRSFEFFLEAKGITKEAQKTSLTFALRWTGCAGHFVTLSVLDQPQTEKRNMRKL